MSLATAVYEKLARPVLFSIPSDDIHELMTRKGELMGSNPVTRALVAAFCRYENPMLETDVLGLHFMNPLGLGGGFDKDIRLVQLAQSLGFGFTEIGSITALPYEGNPKPWTKRLPEQQGLIINYGLRNKGLEKLKPKIARQKRFCPLFINIAKTNSPEIKGDDSIEDYNRSFVELQPLADVMNINISCPNSGDGTMFCENTDLLKKLLKRLGVNEISKPVLLKLKPDISDDLLYEILDISSKHKFVKGFVISNLTNNRQSMKGIDMKSIGEFPGGISGRPVRQLSTSMIQKVYEETNGKCAIVGLGGIFTSQDAYDKIKSGASLVQMITGMIYRGPAVMKEINSGLVDLLKKDGFRNVSEAVGHGL